MSALRRELVESDLRDVPLGDVALLIFALDDSADAERGPFQSSI